MNRLLVTDIPLLLNAKKVAQLISDFESSTSENPALSKIVQRKVGWEGFLGLQITTSFLILSV